ncbi:MAG: hypothetical protein M5U31_00630 [Acidimicrobiia bacterium]|nr:hypothetical protein [Acidimicrobiia bacterium]
MRRGRGRESMVTVAAVVRRPGFRDLLVGQGVSALGDWMGTVAFMALVLQITGSPAAVGGSWHCGCSRRRSVVRWRRALQIGGTVAERCSRWMPPARR